MHTTQHVHSECNGWPRDKAHILVQRHQWQLVWVYRHSLKRQGTSAPVSSGLCDGRRQEGGECM